MPVTTDELHLAPAARATLDETSRGLVDGLAETLVALLVYGAAVEPDEGEPAGEASLLVVLDRVTGEALETIRRVVEQSPIEHRPVLMIVAEGEIGRSTDVFPVKYRAIQRRHQLLHGRDVFAEIEVSREHLRLRCEQELRNLLLRMRAWYVRHAGLPEQLEGVLARSSGAFVRDLAVYVELRTGTVPQGTEAVLAGAEGMGFDVSPLRRALEFASGVGEGTGVRSLYVEFVEMVGRAAVEVDALEEGRA